MVEVTNASIGSLTHVSISRDSLGVVDEFVVEEGEYLPRDPPSLNLKHL